MLKIYKKDISFLVLYIMLFFVISQPGIIKYLLLVGGIGFCFIMRPKINLSYFATMNHMFFYVTWGIVISVITGSISFSSIKQSLIFLSSCLSSVAIFTLYGKKNTSRLLDIQFVALCISYVLLYGRYFTLEAFYYESCLYAYIFGIYGIWYFLKKKYFLTLCAIIFMILDHKRIVNAGFAIVFVCVLVVCLSKKEQYQRFINCIAKCFLFVIPFIWIICGKNGTLEYIFARLRINTMGRLEGTGAWNIAKAYYELSPIFMGRGSGWVLDWLENANIPAFSNLHNDVLTGYIELGFFGFAIWLISFQIIIVRVRRHRGAYIANIVSLMYGFMFVNLLTDNIYLYVTFLIPFYTILISLVHDECNLVLWNKSKNHIGEK